MRNLSSKFSSLLPLLLVIKTYTGFIMANSPYYISHLSVILIVLIWSIFFIQYRSISHSKITFSISIVIFYFLFIFLFDHPDTAKNTIFDISLFYVLASLPDEEKIKTLNLYIKIGAILLSLSMVEYILFASFGIGNIIAVFDRGEISTSEVTVLQGYFNFYCADGRSDFRFQSLFREPGYLGQCAGLCLLFWGKIKNIYSIIWMLAGLLSMSLFYYLFLAVAVFYNLYISRKSNIKLSQFKQLGLLFMFLALAYTFVPEENKEVIESRIEHYTTEKTDNRSTETLNYDLENMSGINYLFGYGANQFVANDYSWGNTGIKADYYKYGLVGIAIIILSYMSILLKSSCNNRIKLFIAFTYLLFYYNADIKYALYVHIFLFPLMLNNIDFKMNKSL